jgi:hypothetical protein
VGASAWSSGNPSAAMGTMTTVAASAVNSSDGSDDFARRHGTD